MALQLGRLLYVPFTPDMVGALMNGNKSCFTEPSRLGEPGDYFQMQDIKFRITDIWAIRLVDVKKQYYKCEGFHSQAAFERRWRERHDGEFDAHRLHYVHWIMPVLAASEPIRRNQSKNQACQAQYAPFRRDAEEDVRSGSTPGIAHADHPAPYGCVPYRSASF